MSELERWNCKYKDTDMLRTENAALTTERAELRGRLEEAISIADYFAGIVEPPDPHNENEPCEQCKMHRRLEAIKQAGEVK